MVCSLFLRSVCLGILGEWYWGRSYKEYIGVNSFIKKWEIGSIVFRVDECVCFFNFLSYLILEMNYCYIFFLIFLFDCEVFLRISEVIKDKFILNGK